MKKYYIAYGSNMNLEQMKYRCPKAKVVGAAWMAGYELEFRGVATIVRNKKESVPVLIWEITKDCEIALDGYEGYPRMYRKEYVKVKINGKEEIAMVYIMNYGTKARPRPSYYEGIKEGYITANFDDNALEYLDIKANEPNF